MSNDTEKDLIDFQEKLRKEEQERQEYFREQEKKAKRTQLFVIGGIVILGVVVVGIMLGI